MVVRDAPKSDGAGIGVDPVVADAVARIRAWGEARNWNGFDPYDGLNSPFAGILSVGTLRGRRLLTQAVKLSPLNLRPALRIRPEHNAKAVALVASGYARLAAATGDAAARREAVSWLEWLLEHHHGGEAGFAWGYHFPVATRVFEYGRRTPNTIATGFAANALLDAVELLSARQFDDAARRAAEFLRVRMLSESPQGSYFTYLAGERELVHNANMLAAGGFIFTRRLFDDHALIRGATPAVETADAR